MRGSLLPLLLFTFATSNSLRAEQIISADSQGRERDNLSELAAAPEWRALLHADPEHFHILDPRFLLSAPDASLRKELVATIAAITAPPQPNETHALCRFPARYQWLVRNGAIRESDIPSVECEELDRFRRKAPAEKIKLVFSSENVHSASSMMGHVLLKLEGKNDSGNFVEHAVSYFTVLDSFNLPRLLYRIFFSGMPGLFALTPYQQQKTRYLVGEERNIWEYELHLTQYQRELIHAHVWELKDVSSTYFFTSYNCATATFYMLALAQPQIFSHKEAWISPVDVVRLTNSSGLVKQAELIPARRWKIKMLADQLGKDTSTVYAAVNKQQMLAFSDDYSDEKDILGLELYKDYSSYLNDNHDLPELSTSALEKNIERMSQSVPRVFQFDVSDYKSPVRGPRDSQWSIVTGVSDSSPYVQFELLAASHRLIDDNRQHFSESGLEMGEVSVRYESGNETPEIRKAILYSMISINPRDEFTGGISSNFKVGFERHYDSALDDHLAFDVDAGIGAGFSMGSDTVVYAIAGAGYGFGESRGYVFAKPNIGMIVREVYDMKSVVQLSFPYNQIDSGQGYVDLELTQSMYLSDKHAMFLAARWLAGPREESTSFAFRYTRYF
jgi:hypothetical protein